MGWGSWVLDWFKVNTSGSMVQVELIRPAHRSPEPKIWPGFSGSFGASSPEIDRCLVFDDQNAPSNTKPRRVARNVAPRAQDVARADMCDLQDVPVQESDCSVFGKSQTHPSALALQSSRVLSVVSLGGYTETDTEDFGKTWSDHSCPSGFRPRSKPVKSWMYLHVFCPG